MKKIGIVTINDYKNYGNRLQNYATQEVLNSLGFDAITIVNSPRSMKITKKRNSKYRTFKNVFSKDILNKILRKIDRQVNKKKYERSMDNKIRAFKLFTEEHINESEFVLTENDNVPQSLQSFAYFVVGSDQIWNPKYRNGSSIDFLTFAPEHKRISYAPSFGISEIPDEYKKKYSKWLSEFAFLSVREEAGARIIRNLTKKEASILADPTLLLSKEKWMEISKNAELKPRKPFLLTYFLGEISKETKELIKYLSRENELEVVSMRSYNDIDRYATDPGEFIDYINSASIFLTDSFHGVVFSILLEKNFIVFNRLSKGPSMNSRIDNLLSTYKLNDRKWEKIKFNKNFFETDFSHVPRILKYERQKATSYLKEALNIEDENRP